MSLVLFIARLLLAATFVAAGVAKLMDPAGSRKSMSDFGVPERLTPALGLLLPLAEILCALALLPGASAMWGASGILVLLLLFIAGMSLSLARGRRPDCRCFGQMQSSPIGWRTVLRNVVLACIAAFIVWQSSLNGEASAISLPGSLSGTEVAVTGLALAVAGLAAFQSWAMVHLLRQNGRLLLRVEALESNKAGAQHVEEPLPGLPLNDPAPAFSLKNLDGESVTFDMLRASGKPLLLFFLEPDCSACDAVLPDLSRWQRDYGEQMLIVPVSRGAASVNRTKTAKSGIRNVLLQADREVANAYQVEGSPSAVIVRDGLVASPLALGVDAIRSLVARAVMPPSVKKGDAVPSLKLSALDGETLDVVSLLGRRMLILFWNPACGFCGQMLESLKTWERNPQPGAPELLVISAGSPGDIRNQGFRARILLDPYFAASQVFQSGGTPSAVLIDEQGIVASDVGVGAVEVLHLTGATPAGA